MRFFIDPKDFPHCVLSDGSVWKWPAAVGDAFLGVCRGSAHAPAAGYRLTPADIRNTWVPVDRSFPCF